jgi:hypothetical protein
MIHGTTLSTYSTVRRALFGFSTLLLCALLATGGLFAQEPGQTPRPKDVEPPKDLPESELVKLDKKLPWFDFVEDPGPFIYRGDKLMDARREGAAIQEMKAYNYVLGFASRQPLERLKQFSAKDVTVANLYHKNIHKEYLRELIHVEGKIALIQTMLPTDELKELDGIEKLYEVWVYPRGTDKLTVVVVPELPAGLKVGENQTEWVQYDAYYFKLFHYESRQPKDGAKNPDQKQWQSAPLFLGKTVELLPPPPEAQATTYTPWMLGAIIGGLITLAGVAFVITLWFRRGDRIHATARQAIESQADFDSVPDSQGPVNRISELM